MIYVKMAIIHALFYALYFIDGISLISEQKTSCVHPPQNNQSESRNISWCDCFPNCVSLSEHLTQSCRQRARDARVMTCVVYCSSRRCLWRHAMKRHSQPRHSRCTSRGKNAVGHVYILAHPIEAVTYNY